MHYCICANMFDVHIRYLALCLMMNTGLLYEYLAIGKAILGDAVSDTELVPRP